MKPILMYIGAIRWLISGDETVASLSHLFPIPLLLVDIFMFNTESNHIH